ncbi:MAG: alpha/beta hydrolase-fold protein [Candidatus Hydrogenedentes bacterium]|nr:alpha/beta hydrolase-fold protein [Candidatus Hydrogenedentota bacterium]
MRDLFRFVPRCLLASLLLLPLGEPQGSQAAVTDFQACTYISTRGETFNYRLFVPLNYDPHVHYPMILLLHGGGESGTDNVKQVSNSYADRVVAHTKQAKYAAFVLAPQNSPSDDAWYGPEGGSPQWGGQTPEIPDGRPMRITKELLPGLLTTFSIDQQRMYITGISDGGVGTWDQIARDPWRWAAAVPIAGYGPPSRAPRVKDIPVWAFMGQNDGVFDPSYVRNYIQAINNLGGNALYTEYPGRGHEAYVWNTTYDNAAMWDWMFTQVKPVPEPGAIALLVAGLPGLAILWRRGRGKNYSSERGK